MLGLSTLRRMAMAAALTTGVGGAATTAVPGLSHWPTPSVAVVVAVITLLGGIVRKLMHAAFVAIAGTAALLMADAVTGGHVQHALNLGALLHLGGAR